MMNKSMRSLPRLKTILLLGIIFLVLLSYLVSRNNYFIAEGDPEPVAWRQATDLTPRIEKLGVTTGSYLFGKVYVVRKPNTDEWIQLLQTRSADKKSLNLIALNTKTGASTSLGSFDLYQTWKFGLAADGSLIIGGNIPSLAMRYDPLTNQLTNFGPAFDRSIGVMSLYPLPNNQEFALGGSSSEMTVLNISTKNLTKYGPIGTAGGYIYSISGDNTYLVGANRGSVWQLVTLNRNTKQQRILKEVPEAGYIDVRGRDGQGVVRVNITEDRLTADTIEYKVVNGELQRVLPTDPPVPPGPRITDYPDVEFDVNTITNDRLTVYYRHAANRPSGGDKPNQPIESNGWRTISYPVTLDPIAINSLTQVGEAIVTTTVTYGTVASYNLKTGASKTLGFLPFNMIRPVSDGTRIYLAGYPSVAFGYLRNSQDALTTESNLPGQSGISWKDVKANPRIVDHLGTKFGGGHSNSALIVGADGRIYGDLVKFRYDTGFSLFAYDPQTDTSTEINAGGLLTHHQTGWMASIDGGKKIAITTRVQYDPEIGGIAPNEGKLFIYDIASRTFEVKTPLPGAKNLGQIVQLPDGSLVGLSPREDSSATLVYKYDLKTNQTVRTRLYGGVISGPLNKGNIPLKAPDLKLGPDGRIWGIYPFPFADSPEGLFRLHPTTLSLELVGALPDSQEVRFIFQGNDIYFGGTSQLRRIRNIVPPTAKLTVRKSSPTAEAKIGDPITYTLTVTNEGTAEAKQAVIKDVIPAETTFVRASDGATINGREVIWNIGSLGVGQKKILTLEVVVTASPP